MKKNEIKKILAAVIISAAMPLSVSATVEINEIMYDLSGGDDGREWVEVWNNSAEAINLAEWKFFEANTNHGLVFSRGNETIVSGGFAIIADNPDKFLIDHPNFSGNLFDSSFSLSNTGERLALKNSDAIIDEVTYSSEWGAVGDGDSLQKISGQWKVGAPTPGAANVASSSSSGSSSSNNQSQSSNSNQNSSSSASVEERPEMKVEIIANRTAIVGADVLLSGKALGADGKSLENARFIWNFGDGETKEGQNVLHRFRFPGEYIVTLDIAYGKWSASARLTVSAIKSPLVISQVKEGANGLVELTNEGNAELDLFGWYLKSGNVYFLIPKNTVIIGGKKIIFSNEVTKIETNDVLLLYPNGALAVSYEKPIPPVSAIIPVKEPSNAPRSASFPESDSGKSEVRPVKDEVKEEVATVYEATKIAETTPKASGLGIWLLALGGLIVVSLGAFILSKQNPASLADESAQADEYQIIE